VIKNQRRRFLLLAVPLVLLLSSCAKNAPQDTLEPDGPIARKIDNLSNGVLIVAGLVFIGVEFGAVALMVKFRQRKDDDDPALPTQTHGNTKLELGWTIMPALVLAVVGVFTVATLLDITEKPKDALEINVYGQQWWWGYEYDTNGDGAIDIVTANDLVIPEDTNIVLSLRSRDVIHSFWAPKLNGKKDAVPGRVHPLNLYADHPGTYIGQCTEFCGLSHAYMRIRVVALAQTDYDKWVQDQQRPAKMPPSGEAAAGAAIFKTKCSSCHLAEGIDTKEYATFLAQNGGKADQVAGIAPNLTHLMSRGAFAGAIFDLWRDQDGDNIVEQDEIGVDLNRPDLEAWLRDPPGSKPLDADRKRGMPNLGLSEDEINKLVAFLETLK
jgi:cytochrome c oxidase subunit 2